MGQDRHRDREPDEQWQEADRQDRRPGTSGSTPLPEIARLRLGYDGQLAWLPRIRDALGNNRLAECHAVKEAQWFSAGHEIPVDTRCTWKARMSSNSDLWGIDRNSG
jgi:hypothetical protein